MDDKVFCSNCGKQISRTTKFCPYCGAANREYASLINDTAASNGANQQQTQNVQSSPTVNQNATQVTKSSKPRQHYKLTRGKLVALIVGLIVIVGAGAFGVKQYYSNRYDMYSSSSNGLVRLKSGNFKAKNFYQINDHSLDTAVMLGTVNAHHDTVVYMHIPIIREGKYLSLDNKQITISYIIYSERQLSEYARSIPTSDVDQLKILSRLSRSHVNEDGVVLRIDKNSDKDEFLGISTKHQKNFKSRKQIIKAFCSAPKNLTLINNHTDRFDVRAANSDKKVKTFNDSTSFLRGLKRAYLNAFQNQ